MHYHGFYSHRRSYKIDLKLNGLFHKKEYCEQIVYNTHTYVYK